MAQWTAAVTAVGTATAAAVGGPLAEVFGEVAAVQALMGFGGAIAMAFHRKESILKTLGSGFLGTLLAVGLGVLSGAFLQSFLGVEFNENVSGAQASAAYAFAIGLAQRPIMDWISRRTGGEDDRA